MPSAAELLIQIRLRDQTSGALSGIRGHVDDLKNSLQRMTIVAGAAMGAFAAISVKSAADFQKSMSETVALTSVTKDEIAGISDKLLALGPAVAKGPQELAEAFYYAASGLGDTQKALAATEAAAKAAASGLGETKVVVDALSSVMNAYQMSADKATRITDILISTVKAGKMPPEALAGSIGRVIPVAAQLGVSFEEVGASMATMTRIGISADESATALRSVMMALIKPTSEATDTLKAMGMTAADLRQEIKERGLAAVLIDLMDRFEGNDEALASLIPNVRGLVGVLATAGTQANTYAQVLKDIQDETGITEDAFVEASDTFAFKMSQLKSSFDVLRISVGNQLIPVLSDLVDNINTKLLPALSKWVDEHQMQIQEMLRALTDGLRQLGDVTRDFGQWLLDHQPALIAALIGIGAALVWANPLLGVAAGIGLITVGIGETGDAADGATVQVLQLRRQLLALKQDAYQALQTTAKGLYDILTLPALGIPGLHQLTDAFKDFLFSAKVDATTAEIEKLDSQIAALDWQIGYLNGDPAVVGAIEQIKAVGQQSLDSVTGVFRLNQSIDDLTSMSSTVDTQPARWQIDELNRKAVAAYNSLMMLVSGLLGINQTTVDMASIHIPKTLPEIYAETEKAAPLDQEVRRFQDLKKSLEQVAAAHEDVVPPIVTTGDASGTAADQISQEAQTLIDLAAAFNTSGLSAEQYGERLAAVAAFMSDFNLTAADMAMLFKQSGLAADDFATRIERLTALEDLKGQAKDATDAVNALYDAFNQLFAKPTQEEAAQQLALDELKAKRARLVEEAGEHVSRSEQRAIDKLDAQIEAIQRDIDVRRADEQVQKDLLALHDATLLTDEAQKTAAEMITAAMSDASAKATDLATSLFLSAWAIQQWTTDLGRWMDELKAGAGVPSFQFGGIVPGPVGQPRLIIAHGGEPVGRQATVGNGRGFTNYGRIDVHMPLGASSLEEELARLLR